MELVTFREKFNFRYKEDEDKLEEISFLQCNIKSTFKNIRCNRLKEMSNICLISNLLVSSNYYNE